MLYTFNKKSSIRDIQPDVQPNLAVSIKDALITGRVGNQGTDVNYTNEEESGMVGHYLRDTLDVLQAQQDLKASMAAAKAANKAASAAAVVPPTPATSTEA